MLKGQPSNDKHHLLPLYVGDYEPITSNFNFKAAKLLETYLLITEKLMIKSRHFERINNMIACKLYTKHLKTRMFFMDSIILKQIKTEIIAIFVKK